MLYKRYHRNFIRQFKEGTKFGWSTEELSVETVMIEPYFKVDFHEIHVSGDKYRWILVYSNGRIERNIKVI